MKNTKRIAAFAMAGLMTLSMAAPVMADDPATPTTYTITIPNSETGNVKTSEHTMKAYQIFTGDLSTNTAGSKVLSNIQWGTAFDPATLLKALKADATLGTNDDLKKITYDEKDPSDSAEKLAAVIATYTSNSAETTALNAVLAELAKTGTSIQNNTDDGDNNGNTISGLTAGYYFVKDETASLPDQNDAYSDYILQVLGDVEIQIKTDAPTVEKKIMDGTDLVDTNSASIGEVVYYQMKSLVPDTENYDNYYYYYMTDTFSNGLTFDAGTLVEGKTYYTGSGIKDVWLDKNGNGTEDNGEVLTENEDYYVYVDGQTVKIAFTNVLDYGQKTTAHDSYATKYIYVNYCATVNDDAVIGTSGNDNKVVLNYSNNPSADYNFGTTDKPGTGDQDKPGLPASETSETAPIGTTPEDIVITYVTQLTLHKYADQIGDDYELAGAQFKLTGVAYKTVYKETNVYVADENGTYYLLKNGNYTETQPKTEDIQSMVEAQQGATEGYVKAAETDETKDTDVTIGGVRYRVVTDADNKKNADDDTTNDVQLYVLHTEKNTADQYVSTTQKYSLTTEETTDIQAYNVEKTLTTDEDGQIVFEGLDAGTYKLEETVVPAGYNKADDVTFTISFTGVTKVSDASDKCDWSVSVDGDKTPADTSDDQVKEETSTNADDGTITELGKFATNIIDKSGTVLPSTGGIGTTIFYVVGTLLVLSAGVVLVAKRRIAR